MIQESSEYRNTCRVSKFFGDLRVSVSFKRFLIEEIRVGHYKSKHETRRNTLNIGHVTHPCALREKHGEAGAVGCFDASFRLKMISGFPFSQRYCLAFRIQIEMSKNLKLEGFLSIRK